MMGEKNLPQKAMKVYMEDGIFVVAVYDKNEQK